MGTDQRYTFINTNYLFGQIKTALKDCDRGAITREECAIILHSLATKLTLTENVNQMTLDEVSDHVQNHLAQNRKR